jgi:hypothetical protein
MGGEGKEMGESRCKMRKMESTLDRELGSSGSVMFCLGNARAATHEPPRARDG